MEENTWLRTLQVEAFRNLEPVHLSFSSSFNLFVGRNGQGKTNTLETVYMLGTGRTLRAGANRYAIPEGEAFLRIQGVVAPFDTSLMAEQHQGRGRAMFVNGQRLKRASDVIGKLPVVSFASPDLEIVRGSPSDRREFLDQEICLWRPRHLHALAQYKKALDQRNSLLKSFQEQGRRVNEVGDLLEPWEVKLAEAGAIIRRDRLEWTDELRPFAEEFHRELGSGESLAIALEWADECLESAPLLQTLNERRAQDLARGSTQVGPHRDDLRIEVQGRDARYYGSQGQQRTAVIALKLATLEVARRRYGTPPLLLLDDIFSDLDEVRRGHLVRYAESQGGQVFITCTELGQAGNSLVDSARVFSVESGRVEPR